MNKNYSYKDNNYQFDINNISKEALLLAKTKYGAYHPFEHSTVSSIFFSSTTNVKDTLKCYSNYKSVLAIGANGSMSYEALLNGAKKCEMFDINYLQKVFYLYMKCAIMNLNYEDFIKHFTLLSDVTRFTSENTKDILSHELFDKLFSKLDQEVIDVFGPIYNSFLFSSLFRFEYAIDLDYYKRFVSFYNEEEFYKL